MAEESPTGYTPEQIRSLGSKWMERIRASEKREDNWFKDAEHAEKVYMADRNSTASGNLYDFNILHSNVETIVPAIYNSTPAPDIRRRFADKDPAAKAFSEMVERAISIQIDDNRLDVEMESVAQDSFVAGRGIPRLRLLTNPERVTVEAVSWRDFRMGKAKRWAEVPWVAFKLAIDREEAERITDEALYRQQEQSDKPLLSGDDDDDIIVWEVWCKQSRKVKFIRDSDGAILTMQDDPLELSGFFPMPEPMQPIKLTGKMTPACPFTIYQKLADELDLCTKRINKIMKGLKVRGIFVGPGTSDIQNLADADDNELIMAEQIEQWSMMGGLDKAVMWWPVDKAVAVLQALYQQRETIKQAIYEITGISDIVRGASNSAETATAQQIKTQWGSLRIQKMQRLVQRQVRDIFVIMAELITTKFMPETLEQMTGTQLTVTPDEQQAMLVMAQTPQAAEQQPELAELAKSAQMKQQLLQMLNEPILTSYRVDIESDSTIKADMTRQRGEAAEFLQATSTYFSAMAAPIQAAPALGSPIAELYGGFARNFNLGKQAEDAIDSLVEMAQAASKQAQQPDQQPSPEAQKAQAEVQKMQGEMQRDQAKFAHEQRMAAADYEIKQLDLAIRQIEAQAKGVQAEAQVLSAFAQSQQETEEPGEMENEETD